MNGIKTQGRPAGIRVASAWAWVLCWGLVLAGASGCSARRFAVNRLGDALASGGTSFSSDDDPDLIRDAAPFSLKTMEALLAESPRHVGLRTAAASGFTQYAFAFVQSAAEERETTDSTASEQLRQRARRLYLRARDHAFRGLEVRHAGFEHRLRERTAEALQPLARRDVPLLYWLGASWAAAIAQGKDQPDLIGDLPLVEALMERALSLDESWNNGSLHGFFILYEPLRPGAATLAPAKAQEHFERALALSSRQSAGPYVSLAESICVSAQDRGRFESLLQSALQINPDARPEFRLENLIMQRRARWLLSRVDELFISKTKPAP
ncbi:MAG: hypothetical protein HYR88_03865 [Verrucomicrobia bacterium]|nr:hypothetical protein [Verrucomicrobiota bacterium]MBI3868753.1 hypothetical protein [Verrucomicrobiota bacterium]